MSLWICGTSDFVARRTRAKSEWLCDGSSNTSIIGSGTGAGGGGGSAAAIEIRGEKVQVSRKKRKWEC